MRVSAQTKAVTKERILKTALNFFSEHGYEGTTTRDIAQASQIATGTLFNYFATKEAIIACLATQAIADSLPQPDSEKSTADSLEEDLFAFIATSLRKLKPLRKYLPILLETSLSPLAAAREDDASQFRLLHLEAVASMATAHGYGPLPPTALQLYWTLYTGALMFWANDTSPKQEDTLALIDDSLNMFLGWLAGNSHDSEVRKR